MTISTTHSDGLLASTAVDVLPLDPSQVSFEKPYKGLDSFQVEDKDVFYGRDREAEQVIAKVLGSRLTVLHAQSGAGKTSLLNARVIPGLESHGWTAVRVIPQNDPIQAVTTTTLLHVVSPPDAERLAMQNAWEQLDTPDSLGALLKKYDDLPKGHPLRRRLIAPLVVEVDLPWSGATEIRAYPWFNRLLRSTVDLRQFSTHLTALCALAAAGKCLTVDADTSISAVVQVLTEVNSVYPEVLETFSPTERAFDGFFQRLISRYAVPDFAFVVLFDQAEELFTRFVDQPVRQQTLDWQLKWEFFEQLERIVGRPIPSDGSQSQLPVRFVISLRSEYLAQLDPVRSFAWNLDANAYHLGMLGKAQAMAAITEPADRFGYGYTTECYEQIVRELARENRYVEPAPLQIVCDRLWSVQGRLLARGDASGNDAQKPKIAKATLERLGNTRGILKTFLDQLLGNLLIDERLETMELLEPLVTRSGTRNVASREDLLDEKFRDKSRRQRLLARLVDNRIVREERRLGGTFIEITHEFLIEPVLLMLKELSANADYARFRWALGTLQQLADTGQDARSVGALRISEFLALHDNRARLVLNHWAREVMLRSVLKLAHDIPEYRSPRAMVEFWTNESATVARPHPKLDDVLSALSNGRQVGLLELQVLNASRDALVLSATQAFWAFRSELTSAIDAERDDVIYWTKRVNANE